MMDRTLKAHISNPLERQTAIKALLESDDVIKIGRHKGYEVYSTQAMCDLETHMIQNANEMAQATTHAMDDHAIQRAIFNLNNVLSKETDGKASLSTQQTKALHHMASDKQLSLVVGVAGAGKTTIMAGAKEALESQGYRVRGAAPSGIAASGLQDIGMDASTLHSLEYRIAIAQKMMDENAGKPLSARQHEFIQNTLLTNKDVLIVDEAGMVSAKQLDNIISLCQQSGAKLVLVGDPEQLQSIEAGAAFRTLLERNDSVSLTEVRRQQTHWQREATTLFGAGNTTKALEQYHKHDCLHMGKTRTDSKEKLVADMMAEYQQSPDTSRLVLAYTRKDVADLNRMIKAEMVAAGKVAHEDTDITVTIHDGDAERQESQAFAVGDRILFRKNDKALGVMNGTFGTIKELDGTNFHVTLDDGNTRRFSVEEYSHIQLGYAATVHKSQGVTVDQTYVLATPNFDRHTSYVAMSRHKENVRLYASGKDFKRKNLYRTLSQEGEKLSTLDFVDGINKQRRSWKDRAKHLWQRVRNAEPKMHLETPASDQESWIAPLTNGPIQQRDSVLQRIQQKQPSQMLQYSDIAALRDQFMKEAKTEKLAQVQRGYKPDHGPSFEF